MSTPTVRLLVLQPTPFCNIACDYCYLANRSSRRHMSIPVVEATFRNLLGSGFLGSELTCIWHAGEPLAVPRAFYEEAFRTADSIVGSQTTIHHSIQTNGILINDTWCEFFRTHQVRVGISLDGPARIHDAHRKTRNGKGTHGLVMNAVRRLQARGIPFHAIAVVTADSLPFADEIANFFIEEGIADVGFNIEEQEGMNTTSSLVALEDSYRAFITSLYSRALRDPDALRLRELVQARHAIIDSPLGLESGGNLQVSPFAITSVNWRGDFSCFSPELLDQRDARFGAFTLGNVATDRFSDVLDAPRFHALYGSIRKGVEACARACEFFAFCGGGSPVNKLNELGSFETTETLYCRHVVQLPFLVALEQLEMDRDGDDA